MGDGDDLLHERSRLESRGGSSKGAQSTQEHRNPLSRLSLGLLKHHELVCNQVSAYGMHLEQLLLDGIKDVAYASALEADRFHVSVLRVASLRYALNSVGAITRRQPEFPHQIESCIFGGPSK